MNEESKNVQNVNDDLVIIKLKRRIIAQEVEVIATFKTDTRIYGPSKDCAFKKRFGDQEVEVIATFKKDEEMS